MRSLKAAIQAMEAAIGLSRAVNRTTSNGVAASEAAEEGTSTTKSHSPQNGVEPFHSKIMASIPDGGLIVPVGSRVTCFPPPTDTDEDFLVLVKDKYTAERTLIDFGFEHPQTKEEKEAYMKLGETSEWSFTSLRLGNVNYIVTESPFFFERFLTASHIAKALNLTRKEDRIMVFEAIRGVSFAKDFFSDFVIDMKGIGKCGSNAHSRVAHPETERDMARSIIANASNGLPF